MLSPKNIAIFLSVAFLFHYATSAKQAVVSTKSKLCGNVACEEVLFKSRVKRVMGINNDPSFLNLAENSIISVVAVKFSDRPDIMEGRLNDDGPIGFFYAGAIDTMPYSEFLRSAIDEKKEMLEISQNPADVGDKRIVAYIHSETDLIRDYNAKSAQAASEHGLPAPEPLPIPEKPTGHGHSHGGHGHSHGGHGHSHGGHGHSHGHPAPTPSPPAIPEPAPTPVVEQPKVEEPPKEEVKPEIHLNNVLGSPPVVPKEEMDAEIERLIMEEEARLLAERQVEKQVESNTVNPEVPVEVVTQPPLILNALPAEPIHPPVVPEVVPEVVPTPEAVPVPVPEVPTTTPIPVAVPEVTPPVETVTLPPLDPVTLPTPVQEPIAQYIPPQPEAVTPPPAVVEEPVPVPVVEEFVTTAPPQLPVAEEILTTPPPPAEDPIGVCYKDECHGLQTPPPPPAQAPEATPEVVTPAPEVVASETSTPAPAVSQEDEDFAKWEAERQKREAPQPYEDSYGNQFKDLGSIPSSPPQSAGVIDFIRSSFGLGNITDASVVFYLNVTFVLASLLLYIIVRTLSSGSDSDILDRQAYFQLVTKHKQLELQLQAKTAEIQNLHAAGVQQQQSVNHEPELLSLRQQVVQLHNELQTAQSQRQEFEMHCNQLREISEQKESQIGTLNDAINVYKDRLERSANEAQEIARQLDAARAELYESQQNAVSQQQQLFQLQQEHDANQQKIQEQSSESSRALNTRISQLEQANSELEIELRDLKLENAGYVETIQQLEHEKSQMEVGSAAESGGSGWSDFGEMDEVEEKEKKVEKEEKTPVATPSELVELRARCKKYGEELEKLTALKSKLEETEKDLQKFKALYEKEERGQTDYERKLERAEAEVLEAKKKIEELAFEKKALAEKFDDMFSTLNITIKKNSDLDTLASTLREDGSVKDKQLRDTEDALRKKDEKIRELTSEFKRVELEYGKLEAKSFHDVMKLKKELDDYKMQPLLGNQMSSRDMFNTSDLGQFHQRQLGSPLDEPLWDEPENMSNHVAPLQQDDYFSSGSMTMPSKRRSSRRSDHRLVAAMGGMGGEMSPSDREEKSKSKKDGVHRRRSRSHGRQMPMYNDPYAMAYMPGSSDSSFMSQNAPGFPPLSGRHSKSGHLHYSSGGSNGARSPPPEMPLLSAIPPPGARKPMSKRADPSHHGK